MDRFGADSALARHWRLLEETAFLPTQSHMFAEALARTMAAAKHIRVVMVRRAGGLGALLPLCREKGYFARWRMLGAREVYEPGDALYDDPATARKLARALARLRRPIALDRVPASSLLPQAMRTAMQGRALVVVRPGMACPTIPLGPQWKEPEQQFNSGRRSDFRRYARRAAEHGQVFYEVIAPDPGEFDALFDEALRIEMSGWKQEAHTAIASDPAKEAFFRTYFRAAAEAGILRMAFLRIDNKAVAMQMALETGGRFWLFKIGYDEAYGKCSPGTLLMLHTIRYAAQSGLYAYELLGNIEPWIAEFWTREAHETLRVRTYPLCLRGGVALAVDTLEWARERLRRRPA